MGYQTNIYSISNKNVTNDTYLMINFTLKVCISKGTFNSPLLNHKFFPVMPCRYLKFHLTTFL